MIKIFRDKAVRKQKICCSSCGRAIGKKEETEQYFIFHVGNVNLNLCYKCSYIMKNFVNKYVYWE